MSVTGEQFRQAAYASIFKEMQSAMGGQDADGKPLFRDIHHWMEVQYQSSSGPETLKCDLVNLEADCRRVLQLPIGSYQTTVPDRDASVKSSSGQEAEARLATLKLRLWQLDFKQAGQVKAGAALHAVRDCIHKNLVGQGNETAKYPAQTSALMQTSCVNCN